MISNLLTKIKIMFLLSRMIQKIEKEQSISLKTFNTVFKFCMKIV